MEREALRTYFLCLRLGCQQLQNCNRSLARVRLQADERNVIQQIGDLIGIMRCIRILNGIAGKADLVAKLVNEYGERKNQLTDQPDELDDIVKTYLDCKEEGLELRDEYDTVIHTF